MQDTELQKYVENISLKYFQKPFTHLAVFNARLRTTGGRYHLETHHLDFNPKILKQFGEKVFEGIVKHELCHYHLHLEEKGYRHRDQDFKELLQEVNGLRYTPSLEEERETIKRWEYQCHGCTQRIYRQRRFNVKKYVCAECKGHFILRGQKNIKQDK